ncbi:hypothetical protein [Flavobacterium sp.]|jgi:hypothetical protein|uniref:hypothetical protein n=1 Tax=Flavobacterium sp. TaxID=239 RepID=UPI0037BFC84B
MQASVIAPVAVSTTTTPAAQAVLDKSVQATPMQATSVEHNEGVRARLKQMSNANKTWEEGAYKTANEGLYGLIQSCYQLYKELTDATDVNLKHKKQGLNDYLSINGMDTYTSKPMPQKIVRCVFGERDRRRISTYNVVLRRIIAEGWAVEDVPAQIAECGGVQEMSLGRKPGTLTAKEKALQVKDAVQGIELANIKNDQTDQFVNAEKHGETFAAVLTQNADGSYSINCIVDSKGAVNAALNAYYAAEAAKKAK